MIGNKGIAIFIALGVGLLAGLGGLYLYQQGNGLPFGPGPETTDAGTPPAASTPPEPQTAAAPSPEAQVQAEASTAAKLNAEPTTVPSFDVVVIDPNGEGVIAGRAAPGWQVSVQSSGTKVATATADAQGEWSAVLDKPLPAGDHALSLKITSPDGTRAVSSQESVRVLVGDEAKKAAAPAADTTSAMSQTTAAAQTEQTVKPGEQDTAALALSEAQDAVRAVPAGTPHSTETPPKPALVFKTVDYRDSGSAIGSVSVSGTSQPGTTVKVYCDDQPLVTVRAGADGSWSVVAEKKLGTGQHVFRAERIDAATGQATATAMVAMERLVPKPPEVVAARETPQAAVPGAASSSSEAVQNAQRDVYTIRRGDTLWAIAKRYLGNGLRYTRIFQDNREVINNPDLILPQQQVKVPAQE